MGNLVRHILIIFFIFLFSLTIISCSSSSDDGASTTSDDTTTTDNTTTTTTTTSNACQTDGSTSRNDSLIVTPTSSRHAEQSGGRLLYVDKSALSQYQTDNYLLSDLLESKHTGSRFKGTCYSYAPVTGRKYPCDAVDLSNNAPSLGNQFTQELRFKLDNTVKGAQLIGSAMFKAPSIRFLNFGADIRYGFGLTTGGGDNAQVIVRKPDSVNFDKWHHLATTFDGTNYRLYLDGEEINNSTLYQGKTPLSTEKVDMIGDHLFVGKIDEVRVWNVVRTGEQIKTNMDKSLTGNESGLVAYYPMDVNNNWEIIDKSSNGNHAQIVNAEILRRFFDNSSCTNGPDGSTTCPFPTIRSALDEAKSGDHVYIRQGRYTDLLNKRNFNVDHTKGGSVDAAFLKEEEKIIFEGYPGEEVIIDGTVALNDNNSNWVGPYSHTLDNGTSISIYKTVIDFDNISREIMTPVDNITQVFVNGRYMIPAMPMNFKNPTDPTTGNPNNPEPGTVWAGIGRSPYLYPASDNETWGADADPRFGNYEHYFPRKLEYLDHPEEWAFDPSNNTLYLYASDNYTPSSSNVRVRVRESVLNFRAAYNFELKNLHFFAGCFMIYDSSYWTIEDSKFSFTTDMGVCNRHTHPDGNMVLFGMYMTIRNSIFEYINDGHSLAVTHSMYPTLDNVLFRNNDWFTGSCYAPTTSKAVQAPGWSDGKNPPTTGWMDGPSHWKYVTHENSFSCGSFPGEQALIEYSRFENLYDGADSSGIQHNQSSVRWSTSRYIWLINMPGLNGLRFDSACGGNNGDINNIVSVGNSRGFRLKGDFHDVYHVTAYDNAKQDLSLPSYKYCGIASGGDPELGNRHSNLKNSIIGSVLECNSHDCWAEGKDPITSQTGAFNPASDFTHLNSVGIWYGRLLYDNVNKENAWSLPQFELENPWAKTKGYSDSRLIETFGELPEEYPKQSYDFRPKKGSYLIDSGVVIPGINDGKDEKDDKVFLETDGKTPGFHYHLNDQWRRRADTEDCTIYHHPQSFSGQNRKYIGSAPDIGAYEYGDSVYWIPGFRYPHPSVPIPNDNASDVPIDHSLVWNYPYKKDYSNTGATVTVSGPGVDNRTVYKYPYNVHFQAFEPGGTYNWSVTVDNVSGGNWSFKTDDKIYPLNDRSVDVTENKSLMPMQIRNLEVSNNTITFLRFDIPSTITDSHKINLNLVVDGDSTLDGGISIQEYGQTGWGESTNSKNIGIIDHTLGATLATLTPQADGTIVWDNGTAQSMDNGTILSIDLTDKITSYGEEYSIAIRALETTDKVKFFSKEKQLTDGVGGFAPQMSVWPNITFK